jgi:hypothetical protein
VEWGEGRVKERTYVMHNPRILITIRSRKTHTLRQRHRPIPQNFNLHAIRIELRASIVIRSPRDVGFV